eukprot:scaffold19825_cov103-Isochrysis_galbana.AAC.5
MGDTGLGAGGGVAEPPHRSLGSEFGWKKALHTSGDSAGHLSPMPSGHSPFPFVPFFPHPFSLLLLQAAFCGEMDSELRALQQPGQWY